MAATVALTREQYTEIIETMQTGATGFRPNPRIAAALQLEANIGLRIGDILRLRLSDIVRDGGRYRLNITEQKTGKRNTFEVNAEVYSFLRDYADAHGIAKNDRLFPFTVRAVQKHLAKVCELLELENISTHSFRKYFGDDIFRKTHNLVLVQTLYHHSNGSITKRYLNITDDEVIEALADHTLFVDAPTEK